MRSRMWGTGEFQHLSQSGHAVERGDKGYVGTARKRTAASPRTLALMLPLVAELDVRAVLPCSSRANTRPPAHRRPHDLAQAGQACR